MIKQCLKVFSVLILILFLANLFSFSSGEVIEDNSRSTRADSDNDGVPDSEDICPDGNGIAIVSVDYWEQEWSIFNFDPFFQLAIDGNGDGNLDETELWMDEDFFFLDTPVLDGQGYPNLLYHGVDIPDDTTSVTFYVACYDYDDFSHDLVDITSDGSTKIFIDNYPIFSGNGSDHKLYYFGDGEDDSDTDDDAQILISLQIVKGTTITGATPAPLDWDAPEEITIKEGESKQFKIDSVFTPSCISGTPIEYEWYISAFDEETETFSDYFCVQKFYTDGTTNASDYENTDKTNVFDFFANYGSAGSDYNYYLLLGVAIHDLVDEFNIYWWDKVFWAINITHINTIPNAVIDITPETEIIQMDSVAISGWKSTDVDGDDLTYSWEIDGVNAGSNIDLTYIFKQAGPHSIKLTVEDDENAKSVVYKNITVKNLDTSSASNNLGKLEYGIGTTFNVSYTNVAVFQKSASVDFPLIWGYGVRVSVAFISKATVTHSGNVTYEFTEDLLTGLNGELVSSSSIFEITYRPYFEFLIELYNSYETYTIYDVQIPVPLLSNVDGLDEDGDPLLSIPVWDLGDIDVYTWDLEKVIYNDTSAQSNIVGSFDLETESINIAQVDVFKLAQVLLSKVPNPVTTAAGTVIKIVDFFGNLYLEWNLNTYAKLVQDYFILIDEDESDYNTISSFSEFGINVPVCQNKSNVFQLSQSIVNIDVTMSIDLHFILTEWGQRVYGVASEIQENGLFMGIFNSVVNLITTRDVSKKEGDWIKTLWESGTLLTMTGNVLELCDSYYEFVPNTAPMATSHYFRGMSLDEDTCNVDPFELEYTELFSDKETPNGLTYKISSSKNGPWSDSYSDDLCEISINSTIMSTKTKENKNGLVQLYFKVTDPSGAEFIPAPFNISIPGVNDPPEEVTDDDIVIDSKKEDDKTVIDFTCPEVSDIDGDNITYTWDFGDGSKTQEGRTQTHIYEKEGTYVVTLSISDGTVDNGIALQVVVSGSGKVEPIPVIDDTWKEKGDDSKDTDGDGLPDWWEEENGLDPENETDATEENKDTFKEEKEDYDKVQSVQKKDDDSTAAIIILVIAAIIILLVLVIVLVVVVMVVKIVKKKPEPKPAKHQNPASKTSDKPKAEKPVGVTKPDSPPPQKPLVEKPAEVKREEMKPQQPQHQSSVSIAPPPPQPPK